MNESLERRRRILREKIRMIELTKGKRRGKGGEKGRAMFS